jgi:hypothetical protein
MFIFNYGSMPMAATDMNMWLFASAVMPALKELQPEPLSVNGGVAVSSTTEEQAVK